MKHIHFKSQVSAQGGICQHTVSSSPLLKNDPLSFQLLATVMFIVGQLVFLFCCMPNLIQALPTFHCKVKELLVLCEGLGGKGHSGAELWVVKLTGSEQDPFTELYIAYTLQIDKLTWVISLLTVTRWESTASATIFDYQSIHDSRLMTDYSQNSGYRYSTSLGTGMQKKKKDSQQKRSITALHAHAPLAHWVTISFSFHHKQLFPWPLAAFQALC